MVEEVKFPETGSRVDVSTLPPQGVENILPFKPQVRPTIKNPDWLQINGENMEINAGNSSQSTAVESKKSPQELGVELLRSFANGFASLSLEGQAAFENTLANSLLSVEVVNGASGVSVEIRQKEIKETAHKLVESLQRINTPDTQSPFIKTA